MNESISNRDHDFICCCRRHTAALTARGIIPDMSAVVEAVLAAEAPSYYIEYDYARRQLRHIDRYGRPEVEGDAEARRWLDIHADYTALRDARPSADPDDLIMELCSGEAGHPRFYITPRRARWLLRRENRRLHAATPAGI